MISLACDLSYHSGWAADAGDGTRPTSGVWELPKAASLRVMGPTLARLRDHFEKALDTRGVEIVALEEPFMSYGARNSKTQLLLWNLNGVCQEVCARRGIECVLVVPKRWRAFFIGDSVVTTDAAKAAAIQRCRDLDWPAVDHNAAEACGIWAWLKAGNEMGWQARALPNMPLSKGSNKWWEDRRSVGGHIA